jgi:DNA-binding HxlR family transcriptional regulator
MGEYRQFCPIARGSEILAERWTSIILRNVLNGVAVLQRDRRRCARPIAARANRRR